MDKRRIVIAAGGTYGHIYPALSVALALKRDAGVEVLFISPNRELAGRLSDEGIGACFIVNCRIITDSISAFFRSIFRLIRAIFSCLVFLLKTRPEAVLGFGGYAAFPAVISARVLGIKAAIHEQNAVMGKANRLLCFFANKVFLNFPSANPRLNIKKFLVVGNPIRQELKPLDKKEALRHLGLNDGLFTVLVMGGSLGAHSINENFKQAAFRMKKGDFQAIHLTGRDDFIPIKDAYDKNGVRARVFSFYEDMSYLFSAADLVISRAGAAAIAEISYFCLPAILIPYPYAGAHQDENAKVLAKSGKAVIIEDKDLTGALLADYLTDFMGFPEKLTAMKQLYAREGKNYAGSADILAQEVLKLAKN